MPPLDETDQRFHRNLARQLAWLNRILPVLYRPARNSDEGWAATVPLVVGATVIAKQRAIWASWAYLMEKAAVDGVPLDLPEPVEVPMVAEDEVGLSVARRGPSPAPTDTVQRRVLRPSTPMFDVNSFLADAPNLASGRSLLDLTARAPYAVRALERGGMTRDEAVLSSLGRAQAIAITEIPWLGRSVPAAAVERPGSEWVRYRRVPAPGACDFCLMVASRGAVYRDPDVAGGRFHANCRCGIAVETDETRRLETYIAADDLRKISVTVRQGAYTWGADLGDDIWSAMNRPDLRPPDIEFLPRKAATAAR